eukprot:127977_1
MTSSLSIILNVLVAINTVHSAGTTKECTDYEECIDASIQKGAIICSGDRSCESSNSLIAQTSVECCGSKSCGVSIDLLTIKPTGNIICSGYDSCSDVSFIKSANIKCDGEQSCLQSESSSAVSISSDMTYCSGRASCFHANIHSNSTVQCNGEASCNSTTINSGGKVSCNGNRACAYSEIVTPTIVECYGYRSCYNSIISSASQVKIHGVAAGDFIQIINVPKIESYSGFTLSQAIIDSGSSPNMDVELFGVSLDIYHESSVVICRSGAQCLLVCKDNGCHTLQYICETDAKCAIRPKLCLENPNGGIINGRDCPHIINSGNINPNLKQQTDNINIPITPYIHPKTYNAYIGTFTECNEESICAEQRIEDRNDGIMCSGKLSCESSVLLASNRDKIIGCTGVLSCNLSKIESSNILYCYGDKSCKDASIFSAGDIQCLGSESCFGMILSITKSINSPRLECGSYHSCASVTMKGNSKDVSDIECNGYESCAGSIFEVSNSMLCEGSNSCKNTSLISHNNIQCIGYESCLNSKLIIEDYIFLKGSYSGSGSIIKYINRKDHTQLPIKAEGYKSLNNAIIDSDVSSQIIVQLLGHLAGYKGTVICRRNSICTIVCHTTGCKLLNFICELNAICNVRPVGCDGTVAKSEGVGCPNIITNVTNDYIQQILEEKTINMHIIRDEKILLFGNEINIQLLLLFGMGVVLCGFSLVYLWYKVKYIEYNPIK